MHQTDILHTSPRIIIKIALNPVHLCFLQSDVTNVEFGRIRKPGYVKVNVNILILKHTISPEHNHFSDVLHTYVIKLLCI